jgi:hypothetical protein
MSDFTSLNQHQKKALVVQLYEQGKTRRQIAEVAHMSFKDIADVIKKHTGENSYSNDKPEKSKTARTYELFLLGKQSVEVAIELDMSADEVEELHVQYWRLSKLDDLEELYHEANILLVSFLFLISCLVSKWNFSFGLLVLIYEALERASGLFPSPLTDHKDPDICNSLVP